MTLALSHSWQNTILNIKWSTANLVSRPSHHPVFDRLYHAKTEREGLVHFITWMTSVYTLVDRGGKESLIEKNTFYAHVLHFEPRAVRFLLHERLKLQHLGQKLQIRPLAHSFNGRPLPHSVYLDRHWHYSRDKIDQAFPLHFHILQAIKN